MSRRVAPVLASTAVALLLAACAAPPNKEMDRAQGAIDAARAAGAEQYATSEYAAATAALTSANDAVAAGDYRLALNYALESHEHAQNAARETADTKARMRAEVERAVTDITALLADGQARIAAAGRAGVPRRLLTPPTDALAAARASLQKAGEAVAAGDYLAANAALEGVKEGVEKAVAALDAAARSQSLRRRR
ncbi:MAG: DUF4398 domain-containing protein [Acidobacteria bacterium]|nr:DUF4398 domain-containing protein [Acidobacteriota bacterium]